MPRWRRQEAVPSDSSVEARLIAALGRSEPRAAARDDYRLKGWVGATETTFGKEWDKGHFIANSIGGKVDGLEANVFVQRRDLNSGWSPAGKRFRDMEQYCLTNNIFTEAATTESKQKRVKAILKGRCTSTDK